MIYFANAVDAFHPSRSAVLDTLILMTVWTVYLDWNYGSRRLWLVDRGLLFILGTWSLIWIIQKSVSALFSDLYLL
jgi:hypothetical protein